MWTPSGYESDDTRGRKSLGVGFRERKAIPPGAVRWSALHATHGRKGKPFRQEQKHYNNVSYLILIVAK